MTSPVFDKTDKGRDEIATRRHRLAPRLRTLLLLIDGKHATREILDQVTGLGITEQDFTTLLDDGFIQPLATPAEAPPSQPVMQETRASEAAAGDAHNTPDMQSGSETRFEAIYRFYTGTIKSALGLRGYALQLKVERAATIDELRALRPLYLEAVLKAKGPEMAKGLKMRLDEVLYAGENAPPVTTPAP